MGSRGASHPTRRRTDPAAEHCDPYELVDRAREGALDESSRRRLTMVLRSQRDAALELAWMQLFDAVREPVREVERTERVVRAIVARVDGASPDGGPREVDDLARTQRWSAVDAERDVGSVDEDARTRRWPALTGVFEPDLPEADDHARTRRWVAIDDESTEPDAPPVDLDALTQPRASRVDVLRSRDERVDADGSRGGRSDRLRARLERSSAPRAATTRTGETAPWTTRPPRRDETPRGTVLEAHPHARGWVALALTAALSIAAGWLAHGWWNAATFEPPTVVASPPPGTSSP